jgi:catechol 2,3-dioxygenase-like lactoylglutathione lyase family enzyme
LRIEHVAYNVPEASKMAEWYIEHLGLTIIRALGDEKQTTFLGDDNGRTLVEFYSNHAVEIPDYTAIDPLTLHIAYSVEDMDAERSRLIAAGAKVADEVRTTASGDQLAFLRDPWGFAIQLAKRSKPLVD